MSSEASFEPIAIVGQGCVLPGALSPEALWELVSEGRTAITAAPEGRWGLNHERVMGTPDHSTDRCWSDVGGYVSGFESLFDPEGFAIEATQIRKLDPLFQWVLHAGREALKSYGRELGRPLPKAGLVLGNLSFPTTASAKFAEGVWLSANRGQLPEGQLPPRGTDAHNRFNSGLPAMLAAKALGLGLGGFSLDAACASSLYAIKLACDRLQDRTADVMLAGAVNRADDLFIHVGFCALSAMSRSGQSRPFDKDADGLVPGEGAVLFVLKRLSDAAKNMDPILGVIRGVGLSNDGRGRGVLAPTEEGQVRALQSAYAMAGWTPDQVGLIECHATGTPVGDGTELSTMRQLFPETGSFPIGSLKSNLGHLVTAAGGAALIKVLAAMKAKIRPKTLGVDTPIDGLASGPFRLLMESEAWDGPRKAAISAFGFGGNNAHLLVEAWEGDLSSPEPKTPSKAPIALVGVGVKAGSGAGTGDFVRTWLSGGQDREPRTSVALALDGLKFPPKDLEQALPQQLLMLEAAREAVEGRAYSRERTAVLVGMGCDPEIARYGARWRMPEWSENWGDLDPRWLSEAQAAFRPALEAAGVLGTMPNIPANRLNSQLDVGGPGFTVSSEEFSGVDALELAIRALRAGEIDAAVVGAVDLSHEPVHGAAAHAVGITGVMGDAAVALMVKRLDDARRDGDPIWAVFEDSPDKGIKFGVGGLDATENFGKAHAAQALLQVAAAAAAIRHGGLPQAGAHAFPWLGRRMADVRSRTWSGDERLVKVKSADAAVAWAAERPLEMFLFAGADRNEVLSALREDRRGSSGPARLAIVCAPSAYEAKKVAAIHRLEQGGPTPEGIFWRETPIDGDLAFVFTGAAAAYPGMGKELALAVPELAERLSKRLRGIGTATRWVYGAGGKAENPLDQLWGCSYLCQLHSELTRGVWGIKPQATIGYSSGESNALFAMHAWNDLDAMMAATWADPVFSKELTGEYAAVHRAWGKMGATGGRWSSWVVRAPRAEVESAIAEESRVHLTIVNTPNECVIAGESAGCERVIAALGKDKAVLLEYDIAVHCPEVEEVSAEWRKLHRRKTEAVPGVKMYTHATCAPFKVTADGAADAITGQALRTVDFPKMIERAYADGVRVFLEHGPKSLCSAWIKEILGDREHLVVPLDRVGKSSLNQAFFALGALYSAGVSVDVDAWRSRMPADKADKLSGRALEVPAHWPPVVIPPLRRRSTEEVELPTEEMATVEEVVIAREFVVPAELPSPESADPAPDAAAATEDESLQPMEPAPELPPASEEAPVWESPPVSKGESSDWSSDPPVEAPMAAPEPAVSGAIAEVVSAPLAASEPVPGVPAGIVPIAGTPAEIVAKLSAVQKQIAQVHQQFLETQALVHAHFLEMRAQSLARLRQGATGELPDLEALSASIEEVAQKPVEMPAESARTTPSLLIAPDALTPRGPAYSRPQLEILAGGRISSVFGPEFADQDGFARQVRMPEPPLLLADRVTGIAAEAKSMGLGTIWTETDVRPDSWYLNEGRMPAGIMIESGQADLLLISWLGVDAVNQGERVYRLLGCELTYHGSLPEPGETLVYDIHVDGHAKQGDVRLFFFHYDCHIDGKPRLTVRHGQAGFFTDQELANSGGILWDAETGEHSTAGSLDSPARNCTKDRFSYEELVAYSEGRAFDCFGPGWELTQAHVRTPKIQSGRMLFLREVTSFDSKGGPWGRGYLRAETPISADDWFFAGHFKNDPCMPGTLMFEGCVQAMAVYLAAMGYTVDRDGWRFEPVPDQKYLMRCRGQVIPSSKHLVYEVFVEEVVAGPVPMVFADLLCTVDGLKAFHARRVGLRLVPDWPLEAWQHRPVAEAARVFGGDGHLDLPALGGLEGASQARVAEADGFRFDYASLLACAWGKPSRAFGPIYSRFDGERRVARLPGPPYHFMSRITKIDAPMGQMKAGVNVEVEYDIPAEVWYFDENGSPTMPFCVLMEAALQPCGWLASYVGSALQGDIDLMFRNLDGTGTLFEEIRPWSGVLTTKVCIKSISQSAGMIIESFAVECFLGDRRVYAMNTVFGFFPKEAFENQVGLPVTDAERAQIQSEPIDPVDLTLGGLALGEGGLKLANPMLLMIDRITARDPDGGARGLGWYRAEKDVRPEEWFFKAHFFQDPVQPGSLGIEAMVQLLQFAMLDRGLGKRFVDPRFEPVALDQPTTWKYRGQVVPSNQRITTEVEIVDVVESAGSTLAVAQAALWVDGKRIYQAKTLAMRIVETVVARQSAPTLSPLEPDEPTMESEPLTEEMTLLAPISQVIPEISPAEDAPLPSVMEETLDPAIDRWLGDHRPTWTLPAMPMMGMLDRLVSVAMGTVVALENVKLERWLVFPGGPLKLRTERQGDSAVLSAWRAAKTEALSRFEPVATAIVRVGAYGTPPAPWTPVEARPVADPYASGVLFHGPAFRLMRDWRLGEEAASAVLDASRTDVPVGRLHPALLDAGTHAIPHDSLWQWSDAIGSDVVGYPYRVPYLRLYGPTPHSGDVRVEARFVGFDGDNRFPAFELQYIHDGRVWAEMKLVEILVSKGPIGSAMPKARRAFLQDRRYVPGISLSRVGASETRLTEAELRASDWLPGNVAEIYRLNPDPTPVVQVAVKDHVAARTFLHPSLLNVFADGSGASPATRPLQRYRVEVSQSDEIVVRDAGSPGVDLSLIKDHWRRWFDIGPWPVEDLYYGLIERFVSDVVIADPNAYQAIRGRSCLYVANHQVGIESLLFSVLTSALSGVSTVTLAKAEHRNSWLGRLIQHSFMYPGVVDPRVIMFFEREDRESLIEIIGELGAEMARAGKNVMVHVEGTRSLECRTPVQKMSSAFLDMAIQVGAPVVPVRFVGGLPVDPMVSRIEFPVGFGRQEYWIGKPILPEELKALPLKERKDRVISAMNDLGPSHADEQPSDPNPDFAEQVAEWQDLTGVDSEHAVLYRVLAGTRHPSEPIARLLQGASEGELRLGNSQADRWLAELARRLFGPDGPKIIVDGG